MRLVMAISSGLMIAASASAATAEPRFLECDTPQGLEIYYVDAASQAIGVAFGSELQNYCGSADYARTGCDLSEERVIFRAWDGPTNQNMVVNLRLDLRTGALMRRSRESSDRPNWQLEEGTCTAIEDPRRSVSMPSGAAPPS